MDQTGSGTVASAALWRPHKPGPYGILIKWLPGNMSRPHFHTTDRFAYVVSGTWWVSTSDHYDPATTWPVPSAPSPLTSPIRCIGTALRMNPSSSKSPGYGPMKTVQMPEKSAAKK